MNTDEASKWNAIDEAMLLSEVFGGVQFVFI